MIMVTEGPRHIKVYRMNDRWLAVWYEGTSKERNRKSFSTKERAVQWAKEKLVNDAVGQSRQWVPTIAKKTYGPTRSTHVYLMRCGDYVKVGISSDPEKRARFLQSTCPYQVEVIASFKVENPKEIEARMHERLIAHRHRNEWFQLSDAQVGEISTELTQMALP